MKKKTWLKLVLIVLVLALAAYAVYPINQKDKDGNIKPNINLGLDLRGGAHILVQGLPTEQAQVDNKSMLSLKEVLENRVNELGVADATLQRQGMDRIIIELPDVKDPDEAIELLDKPAYLEFKDPQGNTIFTGAELKETRAVIDSQTNKPVVTFELNKEGTKKFAEMTSRSVGQVAPIFLDGNPIQMPTVQSVISDGKAQISGSQTLEEAENLAVLLRSGALPLKVEIAEVRTVGPTLGQDSIDKSIQAGLIGLCLVALFMIFFYRLPGLVAVIALACYVVILLGAHGALGAVLTLPGIAGFVLSIGMAVDANVIIFERIKEEIRNGRSLRAAIDGGFKRALTAIIDSNITTFIAAIVLFYFGTGAVRGFAVTLSLGIICSMFTAVFVTKTLLDLITKVEALRNPKLFNVKTKETV